MRFTSGRPSLQQLWILFLAAFTAAVACWAVPFQYPEEGLDPSWAQALVHATDSGRIFGRDVVFTYGPLHQALTAQVSTNLLPLLLARLAFTALWFTAQLAIGLLLGCRAAAAVALAIAITAGASADVTFYLLALLGILAPAAAKQARGGSQSRLQLLLSASLVTGSLLSTLVKLSYLGAAVPVLLYTVGVLGWPAWRQRQPRLLAPLAALLAGAGLLLLGTWGVTSGWSLADLSGYYLGPNLAIVKGYTEAMSYEPSGRSMGMAAAYWLAWLLLAQLMGALLFDAAGWWGLRRRMADSPYWLTLACFAMLAWVVFKASFVRHDVQHTVIGALWLLSCWGLLVGFGWQNLKQPVNTAASRPIAASLLGSLGLGSALALTSNYSPNLYVAAEYGSGFFDAFQLFSTAGRQRLIATRVSTLEAIRNLSESYGLEPDASADVIPWDITTLLAQGLRYTPRPILQSYSAYTSSLQDANRAFFTETGKSPDWLIINIMEIDRRLPIGLDSPVLASLTEHYAFSHQGSKGSLVFRKHEGTDPTVRPHDNCTKILEGEMHWQRTGLLHWSSHPIRLPSRDAGLVLLGTELRNSPWRSLVSTLYRPAPLMINYLAANGEVRALFRLIPKAARSRIVYPIITSNQQFLNAISARPAAQTAPEERVDSFRLYTHGVFMPFSSSRFTLWSGCGALVTQISS